MNSPEFTHVEKPTMDDRYIICPKSSVSVNREKNVTINLIDYRTMNVSYLFSIYNI